MIKPDDVIFHGEAQLADFGETRKGGPWVKFRLPDCDELAAFRALDADGFKGTQHIVTLTISKVHENEPPAPAPERPKGPYSAEAVALRRSGFFVTPAVWAAVGDDDTFLAWCRLQPCWAPKFGDQFRGGCAGDVVAAHVRRVADGFGTGIKGDYAALPLCSHHHALQHDHGESYLGAKEMWDVLRLKAVKEWAWLTLKADLGYGSWSDVPPAKLAAWAMTAGVYDHLPTEYKVL